MTERRPGKRQSLTDTEDSRSRGDPIRFAKLDPRTMVKNPVMFVVEVGALLTTIQLVRDALHHAGQLRLGPADHALAVVHGGIRQLCRSHGRRSGQGTGRHAAQGAGRNPGTPLRNDDTVESVPSSELRSGDMVVVAAGEFIPGDGEVIEGVASVDESAITGESAPVIREAGGDRSAVTGGTRVLSDEIKVRITSNPGETFLDRMIQLVEGASRQKTPNEIALNILLAGLTIIFLLAVVTLQPFAIYSGAPQNIFVLVSLLVCLIPTTIGGLLSAIGIAGMDRMIQRNVIAMSGRAVEASGDVDVLLLDKTGTITLGNRPLPILSGAGRRRGLPRRCRAAFFDGRRNSGGTLDCRAGKGALRPPRPRSRSRIREFHPVHGADQNVWRRHRRSGNSQGLSGGHRRMCGTRGNRVHADTQVCVREIFECRRNASTRWRERPRARCHRAYRRRQGRHERAFRPASRHGNSHRDDHR